MLSCLYDVPPKNDPIWQYGGGEDFTSPGRTLFAELIENMQWQRVHGCDLNELWWDFDPVDLLKYERAYLIWSRIRAGFREGREAIAKLRHYNDCHREWLDETEESQEKIDAIAKYHLNTILWFMEHGKMGCIVCGVVHDVEE